MTKPLRLLALDTGTAEQHVGVAHLPSHGGEAALWLHSGDGGAQASLSLIPTVLDLLNQAHTPLAGLDALIEKLRRSPGFRHLDPGGER